MSHQPFSHQSISHQPVSHVSIRQSPTSHTPISQLTNSHQTCSHSFIFNQTVASSATRNSRALCRLVAGLMVAIFMLLAVTGTAYASDLNGETNSYEVANSLYTQGVYKGANISNIDSIQSYVNGVALIHESLTPYVLDIGATRHGNTLDFNFAPTSFDTEARKAEINAEVLKLASTIDTNLTADEKLVALHKLLMANKSYAESEDMSSWSAYGVLINNVGVCMGFTNAAQLLAESQGIPVVKSLGTFGTEQHSWVEVYVAGDWHIYDPTYYIANSLMGDKLSDITITSDEAIKQGYKWDDTLLSNIKDLKYRDIEDKRARLLQSSNIILGTNTGLNLDKTLTRNELATILARLHSGQTNQQLEFITYTAPFTDTTDWAQGYIQYCYDNKLLLGVGSNQFAGDRVVTLPELSLAFLRLAKSDSTLNTAVQTIIQQGLLSPSRDSSIVGITSHRSDMVDIVYKLIENNIITINSVTV